MSPIQIHTVRLIYFNSCMFTKLDHPNGEASNYVKASVTKINLFLSLL